MIHANEWCRNGEKQKLTIEMGLKKEIRQNHPLAQPTLHFTKAEESN
jgi:hypothetical protein